MGRIINNTDHTFTPNEQNVIRNGQSVSPEDAGASVIILTEKAARVANSGALSESKFWVYINDDDQEMSCIAETESAIQNFIESGWDCKWEDVKYLKDKSRLYEGFGDERDFDGEPYTILVPGAFKIGDYVAACDNSDIYSEIIEKCEEGEDFEMQVEACK